MASDLCKPILDETKIDPPPSASYEGPIVPEERIPKNKSLRSKHLKIISSDLVFDPKAAPNLPASLRRERQKKGKKDIRIGSDRLRIEFFRHYVASDARMSEHPRSSAGKFLPTTPDEAVFDVPKEDEKGASEFYKNQNLANKEFTYINFILNVPFNEKEVKDNFIQSGRKDIEGHLFDRGVVGSEKEISTYKFEPSYNFWQKEYEAKVGNKDVNERAIPNAHVFSFLNESLFDKDVKNFDIKYLEYLSYNPKNEKDLKKDLSNPNKTYSFTKYQSHFVVPEVDLTKTSPEQMRKFNNQIVTQDDIVEYNEISENSRKTINYGFYLELPFETPHLDLAPEEKSDFKQVFKETNTDLNLYNIVQKTERAGLLLSYGAGPGKERQYLDKNPEIIDLLLSDSGIDTGSIKLNDSQRDTLASLLPTYAPYYTQTSYVEATKGTPTLDFSAEATMYRSWDLTNFFNNYNKTLDLFTGPLKSIFNLARDKNSVIIGETNEATQKYRNNSVYHWFQKMMNIAANHQFKKLVKNNRIQNPASLFGAPQKAGKLNDNQRSAPPILVHTPYEILFYKIVKTTVGPGVEQNFYLANPAEEGEFRNKLLKFFDTQVKYGQNYKYTVFAYPLVLGKKYKYEVIPDNTRFKPSREYEWYLYFNFLQYLLSRIGEFNVKGWTKSKQIKAKAADDTKRSAAQGILDRILTKWWRIKICSEKGPALGAPATVRDFEKGSPSAGVDTGMGGPTLSGVKKGCNKTQAEYDRLVDNYLRDKQMIKELGFNITKDGKLERIDTDKVVETTAQGPPLPKGDNYDKFREKMNYIRRGWYNKERGAKAQVYVNFISKVNDKIYNAFKNMFDELDTNLSTNKNNHKNFLAKAVLITAMWKSIFGVWNFSTAQWNEEYKDGKVFEKGAKIPGGLGGVKSGYDFLSWMGKYFGGIILANELLGTKLSTIMSNLLAYFTKPSDADIEDAKKSAKKLETTMHALYIGLLPDGFLFDRFRIPMEDYVCLKEIQIFTVSGKISDAPPVAPQVSFVPLKDRNNEIIIKLKGAATSYYEFPIAINPGEEQDIEDLIQSRGTDKRGRLLYNTDDYISKFEVYRMDEKPKSYADFSDKLRKKIDLNEKASSYNCYDPIAPNKKYYYTFRSIDQHDHFSNPTRVYEFVLNDDGGFLFPEVRVIDFEDTDYFEFSTKMEKYIQIKPSAQNIILDPELLKDKTSAWELVKNTDADADSPLGIADKPVWSKNFKLRITSKTSGKKVDVNFTFTKKSKKIVEEISEDEKGPGSNETLTKRLTPAERKERDRPKWSGMQPKSTGKRKKGWGMY